MSSFRAPLSVGSSHLFTCTVCNERVHRVGTAKHRPNVCGQCLVRFEPAGLDGFWVDLQDWFEGRWVK